MNQSEGAPNAPLSADVGARRNQVFRRALVLLGGALLLSGGGALLLVGDSTLFTAAGSVLAAGAAAVAVVAVLRFHRATAQAPEGYAPGQLGLARVLVWWLALMSSAPTVAALTVR